MYCWSRSNLMPSSPQASLYPFLAACNRCQPAWSASLNAIALYACRAPLAPITLTDYMLGQLMPGSHAHGVPIMYHVVAGKRACFRKGAQQARALHQIYLTGRACFCTATSRHAQRCKTVAIVATTTARAKPGPCCGREVDFRV